MGIWDEPSRARTKYDEVLQNMMEKDEWLIYQVAMARVMSRASKGLELQPVFAVPWTLEILEPRPVKACPTSKLSFTFQGSVRMAP